MDPKKDYGVERRTVAAFLVKHRSHEGVQSALKWLTGWLAAAEGGEQVPGAREMQRLASAGVSPLAILTESAALFLFAYCSPRTLPDDDRLTFAIGTRVLSLVPREKRFGSLKGKPRWFSKPLGKVPRREVGRRIRLTLAPLLSNIVQGIQAEQEAQQREVLSLHKPFTTTKE